MGPALLLALALSGLSAGHGAGQPDPLAALTRGGCLAVSRKRYAYAALLSQASGERPVAVRIVQQFVGMGP